MLRATLAHCIPFAFNYIAIDGNIAVALHIVVFAFMQGMLGTSERTVCK